jgi:hypothetical protein
LALAQDVTLRGLGPEANPTVIDASFNSRVIHIVSAEVTLDNLRLTGGRVSHVPVVQNGGGVLNDGGDLVLRHTSVIGNVVPVPPDLTMPGAVGGGIASLANGLIPSMASASVTLTDHSVVMGNFTGREGGGVFSGGFFGGVVSLVVSDRSQIDDNIAQLRGGGIFNVAAFGTAVATVNLNDDSRITGNTAVGSVVPPIPALGGGIFNAAAFGGVAAVFGATPSRVFGNVPTDCFGC